MIENNFAIIDMNLPKLALARHKSPQFIYPLKDMPKKTYESYAQQYSPLNDLSYKEAVQDSYNSYYDASVTGSTWGNTLVLAGACALIPLAAIFG